jgi:antitoxin MazE
LRLAVKSAVHVSIEGEQIVIKAKPRQGWAAAAKEFVESGNEESFFPDFFDEEDLNWWQWEQK